MKVHELMQLLKQVDANSDVVVEYCEIDGHDNSNGTDYAVFDEDECHKKKDLFIINIVAHQ